MQSGTGTSGSTGWSNAVRSRLYLTRPAGTNVNPDMRVLRNMKANYGKKGQEIYFKWDRGAFVLADKSQIERPESQMQKIKAEKAFMLCLDEINAGEKTVREAKGVNYAPKVMAGMDTAKNADVDFIALEKAMVRLQAEGQIMLIEFKKDSKSRMKFVRKPGAETD
jgi:RecA-family ATPase